MHLTKGVSSHHVYVLSSTMVLPVRHVPVKTTVGVRLTNTLVKPDASKYLFQFIACWVILHAFLSSAVFFKITFFKKFFQEYQQNVKQFGSRSGRTNRRAWSGSKLFAKVISRWDWQARSYRILSKLLQLKPTMIIVPILWCIYSQTGLDSHSKIDKIKVLKTGGSLMQVKGIAECSIGLFCNTFDLH